MLGDFSMDPSSQGDVLTKLNRFGSEEVLTPLLLVGYCIHDKLVANTTSYR